eukprot:c13692_g1_i1.p1 GENE.c13692_g1_i1~~c13692_g1_i1.p1  ORF type:complete len:284 (+),score=63.80 c13692_g1_i1:3-854(+)
MLWYVLSPLPLQTPNELTHLTFVFVVSDTRRENSLSNLSRAFVRLFLHKDKDIVSLEDAAIELLGCIGEKDRHKTTPKVRRLYDIANVLTSINLIRKVKIPNSRKPAFQWAGLPRTVPAKRPATPPSVALGTVYEPSKRLCVPQKMGTDVVPVGGGILRRAIPVPLPHPTDANTSLITAYTQKLLSSASGILANKPKIPRSESLPAKWLLSKTATQGEVPPFRSPSLPLSCTPPPQLPISRAASVPESPVMLFPKHQFGTVSVANSQNVLAAKFQEVSTDKVA